MPRVTTRRPGGGYFRRVATPEERMMLPGIAPAIVTPEEHALAQSILERNKANAIRNNRDPQATLLRAGFIRCGHCGWNDGQQCAAIRAGFPLPVSLQNAAASASQCPQPSITAPLR